MDAIKLAIKCKECSSVLQKPVMLPCGLVVCCKHLENLQNEVYFCKSCGNDHRIENNNKMIITPLEILIDANLDKFTFGPEYKAAYDECDQLDQAINEFETLRKNRTHYIKQLIEKLKNKTELIREEFKLEIDEQANQIITRLDNYEKECIKNFDSTYFKEKISKIDNNIIQLKYTLAQWKKTLNDFSSDEIQFIFGLDKEIKEFKDIFENVDIKNSKIIDDAKRQQLLTLCKIPSDKRWKLIYRGSEHGLNAQSFHSKCDNIPNSLTIIKSTSGCIFGGFTGQAWDQTCAHKNDPSAYLFSLTNPQNQPQQLKTQNPSYAIYCHASYGPAFGTNAFDLCISYSSNYSNLGHGYPKRNGNQSYLTESRSFTISDIDIYEIV